jgi:hypothetical protein
VFGRGLPLLTDAGHDMHQHIEQEQHGRSEAEKRVVAPWFTPSLLYGNWCAGMQPWVFSFYRQRHDATHGGRSSLSDPDAELLLLFRKSIFENPDNCLVLSVPFARLLIPFGMRSRN